MKRADSTVTFWKCAGHHTRLAGQLSLLLETQKPNKRSNRMYYSNLLFGMLGTVATCFDCRRPAFWKRAVTQPTVRLASHDLAVNHLVGAA